MPSEGPLVKAGRHSHFLTHQTTLRLWISNHCFLTRASWSEIRSVGGVKSGHQSGRSVRTYELLYPAPVVRCWIHGRERISPLAIDRILFYQVAENEWLDRYCAGKKGGKTANKRLQTQWTGNGGSLLPPDANSYPKFLTSGTCKCVSIPGMARSLRS